MNRDQIIALISSRINDLLHIEGQANRDIVLELSHIIRQATQERRSEPMDINWVLTYPEGSTYTTSLN